MPPPDDTPKQGLEFSMGVDEQSVEEVRTQMTKMNSDIEENNRKLIQASETLNAEARIRRASQDDEDIERYQQTLKTKEQRELESVDELLAINERYYRDLEDKRQFELNKAKLEAKRVELEQQIEEAPAGPAAGVLGGARQVLGGFGLGGVFGLLGTAGFIAGLRESFEEMRKLKLEALEVAAVTGAGGEQGIIGARAIGGLATDLALRRQVPREETFRMAGGLARGGFELPDIASRAGLTEQVIDVARGEGLVGQEQEIINAFTTFRNQLNIASGDMSSSFLKIKNTADALDVPWKTFMENTVNVAKQIKPFGLGIEDATAVVEEFIKDMERGSISLAQVVNIATGGFAGAGEGQLAFIAQRLMEPGALPAGIRSQLEQAGGPGGRVEFMRQGLRGEIEGVDPQVLSRAAGQIVGGTAGGVAGEGATRFERLFVERKVFQMFGVDLPESASAAVKVIDALTEGITRSDDTQRKFDKQMSDTIITLENYNDVHHSTTTSIKEFGRILLQLWTPGGLQRFIEEQPLQTPEQFRTTAAEMIGRAGAGPAVGRTGRVGQALTTALFGLGPEIGAAGGGVGQVERFLGDITTGPGGMAVFQEINLNIPIEDLRGLLEGPMKNIILPEIKQYIQNEFRTAGVTL